MASYIPTSTKAETAMIEDGAPADHSPHAIEEGNHDGHYTHGPSTPNVSRHPRHKKHKRRHAFHQHSSGDIARNPAQLVEARPIRTCLILSMPWVAYMLLATVFRRIRYAYMISLGSDPFFPNFLPVLTNMLLGPVLGAASDRNLSRFGRRNIFLISGAALSLVSGMLFGSAQGLFPDKTPALNFLVMLLQIGLLLINIGIRARIMDEVPLSHQFHAQTAVALWDGLGGLLAQVLFYNPSIIVFGDAITDTDIMTIFGACHGGVILAVGLGVWLRPEQKQDDPVEFHPPLSKLIKETVDEVMTAPMIFKLLCLVYYVQFFAWSSVADEVYDWWGKSVYDGCKFDCSDADQDNFRDGLATGNNALIVQNAVEVGVSIVYFFFLPSPPEMHFLKRSSVIGLLIGTIGVTVAISVGPHLIPLTFGFFVLSGIFYVVTVIWPYALVGIMGKERQMSAHGFNHNGLFIGMLEVFSSGSQLTVALYNTKDGATLGTDNVLALPCLLMWIATIITFVFKITDSYW